MDTNIKTQPQTTPEQAKKKYNHPKSHAGKSRKQVIMRRKKIMKGIIDGKSLKQIGLECDLSPKSAVSQISKIANKPENQKSFNRILEQSGLDDAFLSSKIRALCDAKSSHFFNVDGEIIEKHSQANETQRKTIELACRLKGHLKEQATTDISVGLMSVVINTLNVPTEQ